MEDLARGHGDGSRHPDRTALARRKQALQCRCAARQWPDRDAALQARPAELRRLRRKARVQCRPRTRTHLLQGRAARRADLRGHLDGGDLRDAGRDRCRDPAGAERLALRAQQGRCAPQSRGGAGDRDRPAAWSISTRWAGRTSSSSTAPPSCSMPTGRSPCRCRCSRRRSPSPNGGAMPDGWRMQPGEIARLPEDGGGDLEGLRAGPARLCAEEPLSRRGAGPFGRHRLRRGRRHGGRCAGPGTRALRDAALCLYQPRQPRGCRGLRQAARRALRHRADQGAGRRLSLGAEAAVRRHATAASPRRTSSRARAA